MAQTTDVRERVRVHIAPDRMAAYLEIRNDIDTPGELSVGHVLDALARLGVTEGIQRDIIDATIEFFNEFGEGEEGAEIARGTPPKNGADGRVERLVTVPSAGPKQNKNGTIDFRETGTIVPVKKGRPLVRIIPPGKGEDGHDVYGNVLKAKSGTPATVPQTENTTCHRGDPGVLVAAIDGSVVFAGGEMRVSACHCVAGHVDYATGNIRFQGTVKIGGDVKAGFTVEATGDIEVGGTVEDAVVKGGGDVTVTCGFVGSGKGVVEAGRCVRVGFVRNQTVRAGGDILVGGEAFNSTLTTQRRLLINGKGMGLRGGRAFAARGMELSNLGTEAEVKTVVELGCDAETWKSITQWEERIAVLKKKSALYHNQLTEIENAKKKSKQLFEKLIEKMETVMEEKTAVDDQLRTLQARLKKLEHDKGVYRTPRLAVAGSTYPGVVLAILGFTKSVDRPLKRTAFSLETGRIKETLIG